MKPGVHLQVLQLARRGTSLLEIATVTGIPVAALAVILKSPLAAAELVRAS